jgi:hypothetical protein
VQACAEYGGWHLWSVAVWYLEATFVVVSIVIQMMASWSACLASQLVQARPCPRLRRQHHRGTLHLKRQRPQLSPWRPVPRSLHRHQQQQPHPQAPMPPSGLHPQLLKSHTRLYLLHMPTPPSRRSSVPHRSVGAVHLPWRHRQPLPMLHPQQAATHPVMQMWQRQRLLRLPMLPWRPLQARVTWVCHCQGLIPRLWGPLARQRKCLLPPLPAPCPPSTCEGAQACCRPCPPAAGLPLPSLSDRLVLPVCTYTPTCPFVHFHNLSIRFS